MSFLNIHYTSGSVHDLIVTTPVHTLVVVQESLKKFTHTRTCELGPPIKMILCCMKIFFDREIIMQKYIELVPILIPVLYSGSS